MFPDNIATRCTAATTTGGMWCLRINPLANVTIGIFLNEMNVVTECGNFLLWFDAL